MSTLTDIASVKDLDAIIDDKEDKLTIIDFHATWYVFARLVPEVQILMMRAQFWNQVWSLYKAHSESEKYNEITFTRCDVDVAQDVAEKFGISAMPTFVLLKGKKVVSSVRGANPPALEQALNGLLKEGEGKSTASFPGQGQTLA
ncbi:hypothetical protein BS47DRAFT_1484164 [Hydnum rufescens UP504]|uniref:Thioredoxin domain-containing protein n=1 Tax=Hydnum rufescens UP504 TaxID=1448309 RepID=A0A9P6B2Z6_9AGAM|nr:hypothetical protein BS47DRAFT_1484164 [Hydnum rufescens UP504]